MPITESGITLNFPDNNYFRFENCKGYRDIQDNFKEMDVCWYDQRNDTLYLIELKNWGNNRLSEETDPAFSPQAIIEMKERISKKRIIDLVKKSVDSVCMNMSLILLKPYAANIQACCPFTITNATQIVLLSIINWTSSDVTYISSINSEYKAKFKSYAKLFDIKIYTVLTRDAAMRQYDWIS
ncbi:MAG: hypothetical protein J0L99_11025 [Chitinophagales bacterium]|nr:hypothetical protein [Chitinophagales bacterium]